LLIAIPVNPSNANVTINRKKHSQPAEPARVKIVVTSCNAERIATGKGNRPEPPKDSGKPFIDSEYTNEPMVTPMPEATRQGMENASFRVSIIRSDGNAALKSK
jgi:hypothetical protein